MARRFIPLSDELINQAQHADLVEYLKSKGETVYREGQCFVWKKHDSVRIQGYKWYQNSTQKGGAAVSFLQHFYNRHFTDAVAELTGESIPYISTSPNQASFSNFTKRNHSPRSKALPSGEKQLSFQDYEGEKEVKLSAPVLKREKPNAQFELPEKAENLKHAYAYLCKTRGLDSDIVNLFVEKDSIYEDEKHNVVFVGFDTTGCPRSAHQKGTNTYAKPFKRCVAGSDLNYPFAYMGGGEKLYVFEAAIDMLSYMCMNKTPDLLRQNYIAMGGLHITPVHHFLDTHKCIQEVFFCTDNDVDGKLPDGTPCNHGQVFAKKHAYNLKTRNYTTGILTPQTKDWNEDLKRIRRNQL